MPGSRVAAAVRSPALRAFTFLLALLALAALAISVLLTPPRIVTGFPGDARAENVRALLGDRLRADTGDLRFQAALLHGGGDTSAALARVAESSLRSALAHRPLDPRLHAACASLDLAARRWEAAERHYRNALDLAPTYGEARLGLGVSLALRAADEADEARARGLRLRAISQFASVPEPDPCYEAALYDRVLLLARVGHQDEARRWARVYLARDASSAWAMALEREVSSAR
jgi:tetratricopeptide (TPR) repeat protein